MVILGGWAFLMSEVPLYTPKQGILFEIPVQTCSLEYVERDRGLLMGLLPGPAERDFFIDNLLVRSNLIIVMMRWTGLAPWEFEFHFPGSLTSTFLGVRHNL